MNTAIKKMKKPELVEFCEDKKYPKEEWENLFIDELKQYVLDKLDEEYNEELIEEKEIEEEPFIKIGPEKKEEPKKEKPSEDPKKKMNLFRRGLKRYR